MKTEVKDLGEGKFEVTCEVDEKEWIEAQSKARKKALDKVEVKGFRKGHVPENIARKHVNDGEVINDAINIVLPTVFTKAMEENKLRPIIRPSVHVDKFSTSNLTLRFVVVTFPKVELGEYKDIHIEKTPVHVEDKEIDEAVNKALEQNAELVVKDGSANKGDTVIFDFEGFVDGKPFEGGKASNYELMLGSGQFIPGFEDQLVGVKANDKKDINVTFPENYLKELKGKNATFKCVIHEVKEKKVPALTDDSVKELDIPNVKTIADLRKQEHERLIKQRTQAVENACFEALIDKIVANAKVNVAEEIVQEEVNANKANMIEQMKNNGLSWEQYLEIVGQKEEDILKRIHDDSKKNLIRMIVLEAIADKEKISVSDEEVKQEYQNLAKQYNMDVKKVEEILSKDLSRFVDQIKSKKLHDRLVELNK